MSYITIEPVEKQIIIKEVKVEKISFFIDSETLGIDISYTDSLGIIWQKMLILEGEDFKSCINIPGLENYIQSQLSIKFKKKPKV
ncbi:MAG: hypothetical protein ACO3UU_02405 [Minisyncoccia bacterium]